MAKKANGVNKSQMIREILSKNPHTKVSEVVAQLAQQKITVNPNLVYMVKTKGRRKAKRAKRKLVLEATKTAGFINPVQLIVEVRALAEKAGGMRHLKQLVELLAG